VGNEFRTELAERLETQERTNRGLMYRAVPRRWPTRPDEAAMAPVLVNSLAGGCGSRRPEVTAPHEDGRGASGRGSQLSGPVLQATS